MARILVLEENDYLRNWYARELGSEGHEIVQAARIDAALEEYRCGPPDFVVMDVTRRPIDRANDVILLLLRDGNVHIILNRAYDAGQASFMPSAAHVHLTVSHDLVELKKSIRRLSVPSELPQEAAVAD